MVYQDPMQALNPTLRIGRQMAEVLTTHQNISMNEALERSTEMLQRVYMPDAGSVLRRYPHQLSGGQQQRVVIAMAMLNSPKLLIMDEPTTALDVTVEAAVLDLIEELKLEFNTGIIFITHNLGVVARVADYLMVMYAGEMVEKGSIEAVFKAPTHPYSQGLMSCIPRLGDHKSGRRLTAIPGRVPPPAERSKNACIFHPRCGFALDDCTLSRPEPVDIGNHHKVRCFRTAETAKTSKVSYRDQPEDNIEPGPLSKDDQSETMLTVKDFKIYYEHRSNALKDMFGKHRTRHIKAVDKVDIKLRKGSILGVVGESGCGKSSLVKGIIGLEAVSGGKAEFLGVDIAQPLGRREMEFIKELQMVFQNPDSTLNPTYTVGYQIARPIRKFNTVPRAQETAEVHRLLRSVKLGKYYAKRYSRQISGGEKQRVGIARALASRPKVVICDEPVSALDVSVQAAVMNLLIDIQKEQGTTMIFIAHDLSVVRFLCDYVCVMYLGKIVESGPSDIIYTPPYHPYTEALLSAIPIPDPKAMRNHIRLVGDVPSALNPPQGCRFHNRCPRRKTMLPDEGLICTQQAPPWQDAGIGHRIFCHIPIERLASLESVLPQHGESS
jgi:peptide/nickel transport system ATP-binding protein